MQVEVNRIGAHVTLHGTMLQVIAATVVYLCVFVHLLSCSFVSVWLCVCLSLFALFYVFAMQSVCLSAYLLVFLLVG